MNPCDQIEFYLNAALPETEADTVRRHLSSCDACRTRVTDWQGFETRLKKWATATPSPELTAIDAYALMRRAVSKERPRLSNQMVWGWAAAAVAMAGTGLFLVLSTAKPTPVIEEEIKVRFADAGAGNTVTGLMPGNTMEAPVDTHRLAFIENDAVGLFAASKVQILRAKNNRTRLRLEMGTVSCKVAKRGKDGEFVVEAGTLTVRVVGTKFSVSRDASGETRVTVEEGRVSVTDRHGKTAMLSAGEGIEAAPNGDTTEVRPASSSNLLLTAQLLKPNAVVEEVLLSPEPETPPSAPAATAPEKVEENTAGNEDTDRAPLAAPPLRKWQSWILSGEVEAAGSAMRRYLASDSDDPAVWALLADCERKEGNYKAAAKAYDKVISKGSAKQRARALYMQGSLMQSQLGDHVRALELFETYKKSAHAAPELVHLADANIIRSLVALNRCKEAEETAAHIQGQNSSVVSSNVTKMLEKCRTFE